MTEWRPCPGWSDFEVSDDGQIRRIRGPKWAKIMAPRSLCVAGNGYITLRLSQDGRIESVALHSLICEAFHGPKPTPNHEVAHWDGIPTNIHYKNLRWATSKENSEDIERHGRTPKGERNGAAKLTAGEVKEIRRLHRLAPRYSNGKVRMGTNPYLAQKYGVTVGAIRSITGGQNWKHI